ncbi:MAG: hypothetical protein ACTSRZ_09145 [Promethearchaeota archaeon]
MDLIECPASLEDNNNLLDKLEDRDLWDEIGFHRPLGGFWYKFIYEFLIIIIPIFLATFLVKVLYPYPISRGYQSTFTNLFILIFTAFDIGTCNTISRYIADENIKNPYKMVQYKI